MEIFWSILLIIIGFLAILHSYKERTSVSENSWDAFMTYRGYAGGFLLVVIGIVTLLKGW